MCCAMASAVLFDLTLTLGVADTVDFAVGWGSDMNNAFDSTGLAGSVSLVPAVISPPSSAWNLAATTWAAACFSGSRATSPRSSLLTRSSPPSCLAIRSPASTHMAK